MFFGALRFGNGTEVKLLPGNIKNDGIRFKNILIELGNLYRKLSFMYFGLGAYSYYRFYIFEKEKFADEQFQPKKNIFF